MQATVAPLCPVPLVGLEARATEKQKSIYAAQSARAKTMFAACTKASQVLAILGNLSPGVVFQVYATSRASSIYIEGCRGFANVLGPTLFSTRILALALALALPLALILTLTLTLGAYKESNGKPLDGWSKSAFNDITKIHLIDPEVELDIPLMPRKITDYKRTKVDTEISNALEIIERIIVRGVRCHHPIVTVPRSI